MTQLALLGDIHGNLVALDAVLQDIERQQVEQIVCLGDVAGTGPQPKEVLGRLQALACPVVMGNVDAWLLEPSPPRAQDEFSQRVWELDRWCLERLCPEHLDFVRTFQATVELRLKDVTVLCFHGSPRSYHDIVKATTPEETLDELFAGYQATVMIGGHTHEPMVRRYREGLLVNPGSVGLGYERLHSGRIRNPPWAEYALVEVQAGEVAVTLKRVSLERERVVDAILKSGMPHAQFWAKGWRETSDNMG